MNLNEAIRAAAAGKKVTTGGPTPTTGGVTPTTGGETPDSVTMTAAKEVHQKKVEAQLYRVDNAETEAPEGELVAEGDYNKDAVDKEINKDKRIKGKEAKLIHSLLKGRSTKNEEVEEIDEAQFILLKKGGTTKRIRNDPDEIARAKAQGWVVVGTQNEETEIDEEKIDELSKKTLTSYVKVATKTASKNIKDGKKFADEDGRTINKDDPAYITNNKELGKRADGLRNAKQKLGVKGWPAAKVNATEEIKQDQLNLIAELSKKTLTSYAKKAATAGDRAKVHGDKEEDKSMATDGNKFPEKQKRHMDNAVKANDTFQKRDKGVSLANAKLVKRGDPGKYTGHSETKAKIKAGKNVKEEVEPVDELSAKKLGYYIDAAAADSGDKLAKGKSEKYAKRVDGIDKAKEKQMKKLTKEDLMDMSVEEVEQIYELSKKTLGSYVDQARPDASYQVRRSYDSDKKEYINMRLRKADNRDKGVHLALKKLTKEDLLDMSVEDAKKYLEEEAAKRGRPSKEAAGEKEHIIVGLRKAISLKGTHDVHFGDGSKHKVSSDHAANILQKHDAFQKPSEKLAFSQRISASHDSLKKAVASVPKSEKPKEDNSSETKKPTKAITVKIDK